MNQILCTKEQKELNNKDSAIVQPKEETNKSTNYNNYSQKYSKNYYTSMYSGNTVKYKSTEKKHLISMVLVFLICILFSYCIYAYGVLAKTDDTKKQSKTKNEELIEQTEQQIEEPTSITVDSNTNNEFYYNDLPKETIYANNYFSIDDTVYSAESGDNYSVIAILNIPSLDIKYPVLSKNSEELMEISLSKYWGAEPNEPGNCVIVGHNYRNLTHFGKLPRIEVGDEVELTDSKGRTLTYEVYDTYNVDPTDVACTTQLTDGRTEMTLITCTNGGATRLVVRCRAIEK